MTRHPVITLQSFELLQHNKNSILRQYPPLFIQTSCSLYYNENGVNSQSDGFGGREFEYCVRITATRAILGVLGWSGIFLADRSVPCPYHSRSRFTGLFAHAFTDPKHPRIRGSGPFDHETEPDAIMGLEMSETYLTEWSNPRITGG